MKTTILAVLVLGLFLSMSATTYAQNPFINAYNLTFQSNTNITGNTILDIVRSIAGYMIVLSGIVAGMVIIVAGLMYMASGSNQTRVTAAKSIFKNGIVGALIIFAAGLIVNTIILLATNWQQFFQ